MYLQRDSSSVQWTLYYMVIVNGSETMQLMEYVTCKAQNTFFLTIVMFILNQL